MSTVIRNSNNRTPQFLMAALLVMLLLVYGCAKRVPIPNTLEECFQQLDSVLTPENVERMRTGGEDDMGMYHFGLGVWMRNNWGLWKGSVLSEWFEDRGIWHPDDMSGIILTSYWRYLNNLPLGLDEQIESYQHYWKVHSTVDDAKCPTCGKTLHWISSGPFDPSLDYDSQIYYCKNHHVWCHAYDKGFYPPPEGAVDSELDSIITVFIRRE